jgi:hypothetical protein
MAPVMWGVNDSLKSVIPGFASLNTYNVGLALKEVHIEGETYYITSDGKFWDKTQLM